MRLTGISVLAEQMAQEQAYHALSAVSSRSLSRSLPLTPLREHGERQVSHSSGRKTARFSAVSSHCRSNADGLR